MVTESRKFNSYSFGYPTSCAVCREFWHGYLIIPRLEAKPYIGNSAKVFLIGQDPTLSTRRIDTVLEFDHQDSPLRSYIESEILTPLGFTQEDVYATNAVKCTFPNQRTPAQWAKMKGIAIENFLQPFFRRCKKYLTRELISTKPVVVFTFGQPTHRLLVSAYHWKIKLDMKDVFGQVFPVHNPISTLYVPVIHYNSRQHQYYRTRWPVFLQEIKEHLEGKRGDFQKMTYLRNFPKKAESIMGALKEFTDAVEILKAERK